MYNPVDIANYFLKHYGSYNAITPMKLVKLVYISHGWHLGITAQALIDENPEAWQYGPVIPTVYHHFKRFGGSPIKVSTFKQDPDKIISPEKRKFLDRIWKVYGQFSALELSAKTHQVDTPWYKLWQNRKNNFPIDSYQIPDNLIKYYYRKKFKYNKANKALA